MNIRHACLTVAVSAWMCATAIAQTSGQTPTPSQTGAQQEKPITLVGCVQREADYRREQDKGRGGAAGTGAGAGNEFVLVNASTSSATMGSAPASPGTAGTPAAGTPAAPTAEAGCTPGTGEAYELTGNRERDLERFVGRRIEITGMLKRAETAGTAGATAPKPTGGFDPMGKDLRLPEVNVTSFRELPASRPPAPPGEAPEPESSVATQAEAPAAPRTEARSDAEQQPTGTAGMPSELPQTASSLPQAGLIGLLSLGAAFAARALRRH